MDFEGNISTKYEQLVIEKGIKSKFNDESEMRVYYQNILNNKGWYRKYYYKKFVNKCEGVNSFLIPIEFVSGFFIGLWFLFSLAPGGGLEVAAKSLGVFLSFLAIHHVVLPFSWANLQIKRSLDSVRKYLGIEEENKGNGLEELREKSEEEDKEKELDAFVKQVHSDIVVLTKNPYPGAKKDGEELQKLAMQYLEYKQALSNDSLKQRITKKIAPKLAIINVKPFYDRLNEMEDKIMIKIKNYTMMQKNMSVINDDVEAILEPTLDTSAVELDTGMKLSLTKSDESEGLR